MAEKTTPTGAAPISEGKPIYKKWWFWLLVAPVVLGAILNVFGGGTDATDVADEEPAASQPAETASEADDEDASEPADTTPVPDYEIVETEDLTFGDTVRFQYRVRVAGEPTEDELRAVIDDVLAQAKAGPAFNAISIGLYGEDDDVQAAYTLGVAEFAPGGDWSAADTVDADDYDVMELVVEIY